MRLWSWSVDVIQTSVLGSDELFVGSCYHLLQNIDEDRCYSLLINGGNHLQHCCLSKSRRLQTVFIPCDLKAKRCKVEIVTDCFQYLCRKMN